jgi:hypothetical protein
VGQGMPSAKTAGRADLQSYRQDKSIFNVSQRSLCETLKMQLPNDRQKKQTNNEHLWFVTIAVDLYFCKRN